MGQKKTQLLGRQESDERNFFNFFSTYSIKDYKQHIILKQNGRFSLITFKLKSFKSSFKLIFFRKLDILKNLKNVEY